MQRLGNYEILGRLGEGGMGVVYKALDTKLGRTVALKVLPEDLQAEPRRRERFLREARAAAALQHPNVATLFELGEVEEETDRPSRLFLAMECVEGKDLRQILNDGALPIDRALEIAIQIADGLAAAHARGIIHRDLKPGNVQINALGQAKILDFGLAKSLAPETDPSVAERDQLTREGVAVGTPPYMAPEQARGTEVDARADLYALGVILYEMLSGRRPFSANSFVDYVLEVERKGPTPIREAVPQIDPRLAAIVERLLQKHPADRFASADEVAAALRGAKAAQDRADLPTLAETASSWRSNERRPPRRFRATTLAAGALVVLLLSLIAAFVMSHRAAAARPLRLAVVPFDNLTGDAKLDNTAKGFGLALVTELSSIDQLSVVDSNVAAGYAVDGRYRELASDYGVDSVIRGNFRREGNNTIVVGVDLLDAKRGTITWANKFDGRPDQLYRLHPEIVEAIGSNLARPLSEQNLARLRREPTDSKLAYDYLLSGLRFLENDTGDSDFQVAVRFLEKATAADPNYADAYAALARAYGELYVANGNVEDLQRQIEAAEAALQIDPDNVQAMIELAQGYRDSNRVNQASDIINRLTAVPKSRPAMADVLRPSDAEILIQKGLMAKRNGDNEAAYASFTKATEIEPENWKGWNWLALYEMGMSDFASAETHLERAIDLQPNEEAIVANLVVLDMVKNSPSDAIQRARMYETRHQITLASLASNVGNAYYAIGDLASAKDYFQLATRLNPDHALWRANLGDVLHKLGQTAEAEAQYETAVSLTQERLAVFPTLPGEGEDLVFYLAKAGRCEDAAEADLHRGATTSNPNAQLPSTPMIRLADAFAICGDFDRALDYVEKAVESGAAPAILTAEEELEPVKDTPRFRSLTHATSKEHR